VVVRLVSTQELASSAGEKVATISFWARRGLLDFRRTNGRTRLFPLEENLNRIRYIRARQGGPDVCLLNDVGIELKRGAHRRPDG
jgi:DNA-binding transcriptional MerR regulator